MKREDLSRQERGVRGPARTDGESADRDAFRHLHDGQERIEAVQLRRGDGHTEDRHERLRRDHPGEVRRTASASDDNLQASFGGRFRVAKQPIRSTVRGHDARFEWDAEVAQHLTRRAHVLVVALASHHDADMRRARGRGDAVAGWLAASQRGSAASAGTHRWGGVVKAVDRFS